MNVARRALVHSDQGDAPTVIGIQSRTHHKHHNTHWNYHLMALLSLIVPLVVFHFLFSHNNTGSIMQYEKNSKWFPLESNLQLLNQYIERLGFDTAQYQLIDIFSTEEWALNMIPRPVVAVILLYPLTDVQNEHAMTEETSRNVKDLWFIKQH
jgi:hypothetical protein